MGDRTVTWKPLTLRRSRHGSVNVVDVPVGRLVVVDFLPLPSGRHIQLWEVVRSTRLATYGNRLSLYPWERGLHADITRRERRDQRMQWSASSGNFWLASKGVGAALIMRCSMEGEPGVDNVSDWLAEYGFPFDEARQENAR